MHIEGLSLLITSGCSRSRRMCRSDLPRAVFVFLTIFFRVGGGALGVFWSLHLTARMPL